MSGTLYAADIEIGDHHTVDVFGMTLNIDTVWSTVFAGLVVIGLGFWMRAKITSGTPSKVQLVWEAIVDWVTGQVEQSLGKINPFVVPLAIALFTFILVANLLEMVPTLEWLPSPTADTNLTYAMAFFVIVGVHIHSVRSRGWKGYFKHYAEPYAALTPILVVEEIVKPFTLALRLFGNIFSSGIMLSMIGLFPAWLLWGPEAVWKLFDIFIALIQAFIFALLTIIYFGMAGDTHEGEEQEESSSTPEPSTTQPQPEAVH
ncbi:MAG: F0F1 ATP synthase subunit A [Nocardioidaceae bacterium]